MKRTLLFIACVLASLTMSAQDELAVGDLQNSGCLSMARGEDYSEPVRTIVLTKEGSILSVQLLNYGSNCGTRDFNVTSDVSGDSKDSTPSVVISVVPVVQLDDEMDCYCPFNVSFTVRDLEPNRFYLDCWWYKGLVELTDGEPIVLEYKVEDVTIDGISYKLLKVMHKAMLMDWTTKAAELYIPSEVNYERETYIVTSISKDAFWHLDHATKMTVPKTVKSMDFDYDGAIYANPFRECKSLEWIDVEDGCPLFSSVDGVLFTKDKTMLLGYPIASSRKTYTVPEGVTNIRSGAFQYNKYLRKLVIPEEVTYLGWHLFSGTESLEELYIRGVIKPECMSDLFGGMDTKVAVYVQPSEIEKFQAVYQGPVYPLPEQTSDNMAYRPFIEDDKEWVVKVISNGWPTEEWIEYYYFDGDTIVNGQTAKRMLCDRIDSSQDISGKYVGAWYEQDKKVYYAEGRNQPFKLLYDFTLSTGETLKSIDIGENVQVTKMMGGIPGFKGTYYNLTNGDYDRIERWYEGVGSEYYPWLNLRWFRGPAGAFGGNVGILLACCVSDEFIYYNSEEGDPYIMGARKKRFDFTHTTKEKPKTRTGQESEQSPYGEYNEQRLGINLDPLNDVYLVHITDGTGKAVYEKTIDAVSIVALNIDISSYPKGSYTVTVENGHESFTGYFDTQATGIETVRNKEEVRGRIYNLQGQRLSSLQKGLNIVNGQKVYVK